MAKQVEIALRPPGRDNRHFLLDTLYHFEALVFLKRRYIASIPQIKHIQESNLFLELIFQPNRHTQSILLVIRMFSIPLPKTALVSTSGFDRL